MPGVRDRVHRGVVTGPLAGFGWVLGLLAVLSLTSGLSAGGWLTGVACGAGLALFLARALARDGRSGLGPADRVTLARAVLACAVAALTAASLGSTAPAILVVLATLALALDGVDGRIARRKGTASEFGARFDFEVDAFLILVLSVCVAAQWGWWVLSLGVARYAFVAAGRVLPWLRGSPPPRRSAKVVAVIVGVVLTVAAAGVPPDAVIVVMLGVAVVLLAESFAHSVWELWRLAGGRPFPRATASAVVSLLLVWVALLFPAELDALTPAAFLRIPVEGLLLVALVLMLPPRIARFTALLVGLGLGALTILRLLDIGFLLAFDAPFHPVFDMAYAGPAVGLLDDSIGRAGALAAIIGAVALVVALLTLLPLSVLRLSRLVAQHKGPSVGVLAGLTAVALVTSVSGIHLGPAGTVASTSSARLAYAHATQVRDDLRDQQEFDQTLAEAQPRAGTSDNGLLSGLRGKDVLLVFVESYGRTALDIPVVHSALGAGERRLQEAGFSARSGWLTSSTFGGGSWLAHITLQSGLWVDNQQRYDHVLTLDRPTLTDAFGRAGWRTLLVAPAIKKDWPEGTSYYHYDKIYDARNVGYAGPRFSWATMPDQFTLAAFQRLELGQADRPPIMAEVSLVSSHWPWTPIPRFVDWDSLGDGSIFAPMAAEADSPGARRGETHLLRAAYGRSIAYSLETLTSFVQRLHDPDLVLVVVGDHQPSARVSGKGASRDVPVSIIAADPAITARAERWGWTVGLRPDAGGPVWPMDAFRERFLTAYGADSEPSS